MLKVNIRHFDEFSKQYSYIMSKIEVKSVDEAAAYLKGFAKGFSWYESAGHLLATVLDENGIVITRLFEKI